MGTFQADTGKKNFLLFCSQVGPKLQLAPGIYAKKLPDLRLHYKAIPYQETTSPEGPSPDLLEERAHHHIHHIMAMVRIILVEA